MLLQNLTEKLLLHNSQSYNITMWPIGIFYLNKLMCDGLKLFGKQLLSIPLLVQLEIIECEDLVISL